MCSLKTTWIVLFVAALTVVAAEEFLQILPKSRPIRKEVGSNLVLTCRPSVPNTKLVTNLEWRDRNDKKIETISRASTVYVQKLPSDEPGAMLIFNGLTAEQAGNYSCHASYANTQLLSAHVEVTTFVDIEFVEANVNQYATLGLNFNVKCKVRGKPYPIIEWLKGDQLIDKDSKRYRPQQDSLLIKNVTEQDDGIYKCSAVVPSTGAYKTRNIKVEVRIPPKVLPMKEISVVEGETASAKCSATGKPPPTYTWIKLDRRIDLSKTDRFSVNPLTGELIMNRVEFNDDGMYMCSAENGADRANTTVKITVLVKPQIYELLNVTSAVDNETRIICKVKGRPAPRVTFRKLSNSESYRPGVQVYDPRIVLEQELFEDRGEASGTLIISNLARPDDGLYQCIAENRAGSAYKNGHITVWFKPTFNRTKELPPVWSWDGRPGNLTCLPEAIPNATIVWRFNQIEISEENFNNGRLQRSNFQVIGRSPSSTLIVHAFNQPSFYTFYECIARNALGEASIDIMLKRGEPPAHLNQARIDTVTATTIKFSIVPPSNYDGLPIRSYSVQYKPDRQQSWDNSVTHTWSNGSPYILENLIPEVTYHFRFAARNDVGRGGWTNTQSQTMPRRSQPAEPTFIPPVQGRSEVASSYSDHFEIRWNVPADNGEEIIYYSVRYCAVEQNNGDYRDRDCTEDIQQSVQYTNFNMERLMPDTLYKVELKAHNAIGDSTPAQLWVRTARGIGPVVPVEGPAMSSALIVGIVVAALLVILIVVDLTCFLVNRTGLIALCCERAAKKKKDEEDPKLGSEEKEPLKQPSEKPVSVEFDGRHVFTKSGEIIGKHSAV